MENVSSVDPYEQKLYQMFTSFDGQSKGSLDKEALIKLCTTLELKDRAPKLVACLIERPSSRVTFKQFKEGLLNLLGTEDEVELGWYSIVPFFSQLNVIYLSIYIYIQLCAMGAIA